LKKSGSLFALVCVVLIGMTGFGVFLPIFPFLALDLGATPTAATIAMGAYSFGQLIASPLWGRLSDKVGRKPVLIAGLLGGVASYLWLSRAASVEELGAARLFGGLMAGNVGAAFAATADISDDDTRARNMGFLGAAVGLGFIAGPALGAAFIGDAPSREDFARVCVISAMLGACATVGALLFFKETAQPSLHDTAKSGRVRRLALLTSRPALARLCAVVLFFITAQALMETTFGLWAEAALSWGPREVGWTLAALGVGAVLLQGGLAGRAARMLGERVTLLIGLGLCAAGFGGLAVAQTVAALAAALGALVAGIGLSTPALNALVAEQAAAHERGAVMGLSQSASALGRVLAPLGAGLVFEGMGASAPFIAAALLVLLAVFLAQETPSRFSRDSAARSHPDP
jgi:DHA1 family tetracycline resistance protein-like MFS transporter